MPSNSSSRKLGMRPAERRRSFAYAYANGGIWGMASGLASTTLIYYLAGEYNATGLAIGWLVAAPSLAGLLRLLTPMWMDHIQSRRRFCVGMFLASALVLFALPIISAPHVLPEPGHSILALGVMWSTYHVLEYMGAVALWSWYGDLAPRRIRGRFVARRQALANVGKVIGTLIAAVGTYQWHNYCETIERADLEWMSYASCGLAGAFLVAVSTLPLLRMVDLEIHASEYTPRDTLRHQLFVPWLNAKFRRLLYFGLWFSFSNGIVQSAQWKFQFGALSFVEKKALDAVSRGIQASIMPSVGNWVDRHGNVRVLTISQSIIALAPLFFLLANAEGRYWILGAYLCWLAYAGENVTQPNLMLSLSPRGETPSCVSAWYAWTQFMFSLSSLLGGWLFDWMKDNYTALSFGGVMFDRFAVIFLLSWLLKSIGALWAARIQE